MIDGETSILCMKLGWEENKYVNIEDISLSHLLLMSQLNEIGEVEYFEDISSITSKVGEVVEIVYAVLDFTSRLICSPDQKILTSNMEWTLAKNLTNKDILVGNMVDRVVYPPIIGVKKSKEKRKLYSVKTDEDGNYLYVNQEHIVIKVEDTEG